MQSGITEQDEDTQMNEYNKRPYIIELYGVLPTVVALLIFGAFRNQDLSDTIRWIFIGVLALAIIALLKSTALFFVGVATVLEKAYFHHPLTGYVCALLVGIGLVASTEKDRQARIFRAVLFVLGLGLAPILLPEMTRLLFWLLSAAAVASLLFAISMTVRTEVLSNPLATWWLRQTTEIGSECSASRFCHSALLRGATWLRS